MPDLPVDGAVASRARLAVRPITAEQHLGVVRARGAAGHPASFLQTPAWATVKPEWEHESLGWYADTGAGPGGGELVGAGLVLYRRLPKVRRYLAYLPEGPLIDWTGDRLADWLEPLAAHVRRRGAFGVRIGPPVVVNRWTAAQVKQGVADPAVRRLRDLPPQVREPQGARVVSQLTELGWLPQTVEGGFGAGQPAHVFQVPLRHPDGSPRSEAEVLSGMNQLWRRNIKKAEKAGVEVSVADPRDAAGLEGELKAFHDLYVHTAQRDHFTPRPLSYFVTMARALGAEDPDRFRLYLARHQGDLVAATVAVRVDGHVWYSYGASSTDKREVRGSNATQWAMLRDALAAGADVYDLRGITDTLDEGDGHVGLVQFKVGTGGEAVEYAGEWDLPINRPLYRLFDLYLKRRSRS